MNRALVDQIAPPVYAAVDFVVIVTPALAFKFASDRGGMGDAEGVDLIVASTVIGMVHALIGWSRLRTEERVAVRRLDLWIASLDSLVVLALGATLLPLAVLYGFADEHASLADRGFPVVVLWTGVLLLAVAASEVTARAVFGWLEPPTGDRPGAATRASTSESAETDPQRQVLETTEEVPSWFR